MNDKSGNYGLLFRVLEDAQEWYASRAIPYVTAPTNNPEKKRNNCDLLIKISKDILNTGKNGA